MRFAWLSDNHLGYMQYGLDRRRADFEYAFESSVDAILAIGIKLIVDTGDLLNSNRPGPEAIECLRRVHRKLIAAGARMLVISGNHDRTDPPWPTLLEPNERGLGITVQDKQVFSTEGVSFFCLPYVPVEQFKTMQWPAATVLLCHQMVQEFVGYPAPNALTMADLPYQHYKAILIGDVHVSDTRPHPLDANVLVGYIGSTELCSESEHSEKFWAEVHVEPGKVMGITSHQIPTRRVYRRVLENLDQVPSVITVLQSEHAYHVEHTGDTREGIIFVEHFSDMAGLMERFRAAFNPDKWILRFKSKIRLLTPTGVPVNPGETDLTTGDILKSQLAMRQDLLPVATQLINPEIDANAAVDEFIENRLRAIEAPAGTPNG